MSRPGVMIIGGTGLLGQALTAEARRRAMHPVTVARRGADLDIDIADAEALRAAIAMEHPGIVVNAAAVTDLNVCESDPGGAYVVNARAPAVIAEACRAIGARFVQISTDHFYTGDGAAAHGEDAPVRLVNDYARTKFAGEASALAWPETLAVRTNFTGVRGWPDRPTFLEWAMTALETRSEMSLFEDYHTSTIDAGSLARAIFDLVEQGAIGVLNVASREVASKHAFVGRLAEEAGIDLDWATAGSVRSLATPRAESAGLDVSKAERSLGYQLPGLATVARSLVAEWRAHATVQTV